MTEQEGFSDVFAQFDELAEAGSKPALPPSNPYTRQRSPGLYARAQGWLVDGRGLLLGCLLAFVAVLSPLPSLVPNLLFALVVYGWACPLLGRRPLAQPVRFFLLTLACDAALVAASVFTLGAQRVAQPPNSLAFALCTAFFDQTQRACAPWSLGVVVAAFVGSMLFGRRLAQRTPWLETKAPTYRLRRVLSLLVGGLAASGAVLLPFLPTLAVYQAWIPAAQKRIESRTSLPPDPKTWKDVTAALPGWDTPVHLTEVVSDDDLGAAQARVAERLRQYRPVDFSDKVLLRALLERTLQMSSASQESAELAWAVYFLDEQSFSRLRRDDADVRKLVARHLMPMMADAASTPEWVELWSARISAGFGNPTEEELQADVDGRFMRALTERLGAWNHVYQTVRWGDHRAADHPAARAALELEKTFFLLHYGYTRRAAMGSGVSPVSSLWPERFLWPLVGNFYGPLRWQFVHEREIQSALEDLVKLKTERARNGVFPANPELSRLNDWEYECLGKTARLRLPDPASHGKKKVEWILR